MANVLQFLLQVLCAHLVEYLTVNSFPQFEQFTKLTIHFLYVLDLVIFIFIPCFFSLFTIAAHDLLQNLFFLVSYGIALAQFELWRSLYPDEICEVWDKTKLKSLGLI